MRCPMCMQDVTETVLIGSIAQHVCRRCSVYLVEGLDHANYWNDLLKLLQRFIDERKTRHDRSKE